MYEKVIKTGKPIRFENHAAVVGRMYEVHAFRIEVPKKNRVGIVFNDITDRKRSEQKILDLNLELEKKVQERTFQLRENIKELEEAKAKNEAILLSLGAALVVVNKEGKIELVNKAFEKALGWKQEEVKGKNIDDILSHDEVKGIKIPFTERILSHSLLGKSKFRNSGEEYCYIRKNKTKFPVSSFFNPILLKGKIIGAVEIFRDISAGKESDIAKGDFISLAAHQLRTPLSVVSWYTEMLLEGDGGELEDIQKDYFQEIYNATGRMLEMVNSLLNVAMLDVGEVIIRDEYTDVVLLIQDVVDEQKNDILEKEINLVYKYSGKLPLINIDPKRLRMVLQNLISNSVKYSDKKGKIEISIKVNDKKYHQMMLLSIKDNGFGILTESKKKIFTKFYRADNVVQRSTDGTGLGMYLAKNIVDSSGGKI